MTMQTMFVQVDTAPPPPGRQHPWTASVTNADWKYYDLKAQPELIRTVLEDFTPWNRYAAIVRFYELLEWLNGSESQFESNDCGLRPPRIDPAPPPMIPFESPVVVHGRLSILYRALEYNCRSDTVGWLQSTLMSRLKNGVPNFPVVLFVGHWPHFFTEIDKEGDVMALRFWAWGESDEMAMENLAAFYTLLTQCLQAISADFRPNG